jgi:sugar phosphate permease
MMRYNPDNVSREIGPDGLEHMYVNGALAIRIFVIFALAYVMSYAFRAINAVIAQPLVAELGLSASQLGFLASAYFLSFAVMQLPVGVMLDRYGTRATKYATKHTMMT